jgi:translation initiation factor eIF-2B subunit alpha
MEGKTKEDDEKGKVGKVVALPSSVSIENPPCDFTPAKYITLLFTDLGVLTPSAVSDELIRLYQ